MSEASDQITEYLSVGGLFNPEMMNQTQHETVRDTLIKARDDIQSLERENAALREDYRKLAKVISRTERSHAREVSFTKLQLGVAKSENAALREQVEELDAKWKMAEDQCFDQVGKIGELERENAALRDSIDHAETLLCNSLPMAHCKQSDWDKLIRKWRDQKHAIDAARKEAQS